LGYAVADFGGMLSFMVKGGLEDPDDLITDLEQALMAESPR